MIIRGRSRIFLMVFYQGSPKVPQQTLRFPVNQGYNFIWLLVGQGKNLSFFHFSGFIRFRRKPSGIEFLHLATFFFRIGNSVLQRCPKRSADSASRGKKRDFCRGAFKTECGFGLKWESFSRKQRLYVGVSLNGGTPKTPQNDHF